MAFFLISPELYAWVILPLLIFFARICDVSMETIRVIYISRGIKYLAPVIAFFEIVIWLLAMEVVMQDLSNIANFMAFALGFATGTYVGLVLEERLSIGMVILRVITTVESEEQISSFLARENCGVTTLDAEGSRGNVKMLISLVNRIDLPKITDFIRTVNPHAFFSIEDVRYVNEGVFNSREHGMLAGIFNAVLHLKKK